MPHKESLQVGKTERKMTCSLGSSKAGSRCCVWALRKEKETNLAKGQVINLCY